jgi:hypothetical protein
MGSEIVRIFSNISHILFGPDLIGIGSLLIEYTP